MSTKVINGLDIKIAGLKAGLRQYDLAAILGIPPSRLSEIESGRRKPAPEIVRQILKILGKSKQPTNQAQRNIHTRKM